MVKRWTDPFDEEAAERRRRREEDLQAVMDAWARAVRPVIEAQAAAGEAWIKAVRRALGGADGR